MKMVQYKLLVLLAALCGVYGGYDVYDLISSDMCPTRRNALLDTFLSPKKDIRILTNTQKGVIYEQTWNSSSFKRYNECKFTIQATTGTNLFLIVRKMNLRRDAKGNCIDTITVKQSYNRKEQFCYTPMDVPRSFSDESPMKITIKLDRSVPLATVDDTLHVQLVVTPSVECLSGTNTIKCLPFVYNSCIDSSFQRDGTINCPNCSDEGGCSESEKVQVADNQSIILTAFSSLIATMVVVGCCIMCVYKSRSYWPTCGSDRERRGNDLAGRRARTRGSRTTSSGVLSVELPDATNGLQPSAPKLDEKDLPPSYDALFPSAPVASGPTTVSTATSPTIPVAERSRAGLGEMTS